MKQTGILFIILSLMLLSANASANTMTYDSISDPNWTSIGSPYTEDGLTMTTVSSYGSGYPRVVDNTTASGRGAHFEGGLLKFDMGGTPFNLDAIRFDILHDDIITNQILFSNGLTYNFVGSWVSPIYLDFSSVSMAKSISYFTINLAGNGYCSQIDFINTAPIPEPGTMLLLGTGLVGVAGAVRRRKNKQT